MYRTLCSSIAALALTAMAAEAQPAECDPANLGLACAESQTEGFNDPSANNSVFIRQLGTRNIAELTQQGLNNAIILNQYANDTYAEISQRGNENYAEIDQTVDFGEIVVSQRNDRNYLEYVQNENAPIEMEIRQQGEARLIVRNGN